MDTLEERKAYRLGNNFISMSETIFEINTLAEAFRLTGNVQVAESLGSIASSLKGNLNAFDAVVGYLAKATIG